MAVDRRVPWILAIFASAGLSAGVVSLVSSSREQAKTSAAAGDLERIVREAATQQAELNGLTHQVAEEKEQLADARADVAFEECEASLSQMQAEALLLQAQCFGAYSEASRCDIKSNAVQARKGALAAPLTAALAYFGVPPTVGASVVAAGIAATARACSYPQCDPAADKVVAEIMRRHGLSKVPTCAKRHSRHAVVPQ